MRKENVMDGYSKIDQYDPVRITRMAEQVRGVLTELGEDPDREGLVKTPDRVARAYSFLTKGYSEDPKTVITAVKQRLVDLQPTLAREQLSAVSFYDRSQLIRETTATVTATLQEAVITTIIVVVAFLLHVRASLAGYKTPKRILVTRVPLRASNGKADYKTVTDFARRDLGLG